MYQLNIEYFWPLTEQIGLDLDYTGCNTRENNGLTLNGDTGLSVNALWASTSIAPQLTITPNNPVGTLSIGGMNIGLEKKPNLFQRVLHKILGFDWKDK